jgi:hypothetical protein
MSICEWPACSSTGYQGDLLADIAAGVVTAPFAACEDHLRAMLDTLESVENLLSYSGWSGELATGADLDTRIDAFVSGEPLPEIPGAWSQEGAEANPQPLVLSSIFAARLSRLSWNRGLPVRVSSSSRD